MALLSIKSDLRTWIKQYLKEVKNDIAGEVSSLTASIQNKWSGTGDGGKSDYSDNYIGTTDAIPIRIITDSLERACVLPDGKMGVSTINPQSDFEVGKTFGMSVEYFQSAANPVIENNSVNILIDATQGTIDIDTYCRVDKRVVTIVNYSDVGVLNFSSPIIIGFGGNTTNFIMQDESMTFVYNANNNQFYLISN